MNPTYKNLPGNILSNNKASYMKSGSNTGNTRDPFSNNNLYGDNANNRTKNGFGVNNQNFGGFGNQNKNNQQDDLNDANDSLKLLRLKMGNNNSPNQNTNNNNNNYGNTRTNTLSNNNSNSNNDNYRKVFNPNTGGDFGMKNSNLIEIDKKSFMNNNNNNFNDAKNAGGNQGQLANSALNNNNSNKNPVSIQGKKVPVEEVIDDRPAFNEKGEDIYDPEYLEEQEEGEDNDDPNLIQCMHCGRRFKEEAIEKHEGICKKIFCTQRKKFDIKKKRILDSEHAMLLKRQEKDLVDKKLQQVKAQKKQKWKKMSEEFRSIIKANNTTTGFGNFGGDKNGNPNSTARPPVRSVIEEDYKHCELCSRRYNENAYDKHLPSCQRRARESQVKNKGKPGTGSIQTANTTSYANSKPNFNLKFNKK